MPVSTAQAIESATNEGRTARSDMNIIAASIAEAAAAKPVDVERIGQLLTAMRAATKRYEKARTRYHAYHSTAAA